MAGKVENKPGGSRARVILLIDDHADTRELYTQVLKMTGYTTHGAADGFEAWEKATGLKPDVIVTDVGLPRMDGIELCRRLKANDATAHIPIIALTGFGEAVIADRVRSLGIAKVLVKPCSPDVLLAEIEALCSSAGGGAASV